ncbi:glycoside hydrolase family 25 protein [Collinsella sp. An307]|uniref:glycoside hydrolase family 25 protein n=1 Tax=Collinsella sp. An307 TaxID=1965630 RepID=UPI001302D29A|nr:glycoside hydrolase family 25 protein [Collinsella sp. An307]
MRNISRPIIAGAVGVLLLTAVTVPVCAFAEGQNDAVTSQQDEAAAVFDDVAVTADDDIMAVQGDSSAADEGTQQEPEQDASGAFANSFRFVDGYLIDGASTETSPEDVGISTAAIDFSKGGNTWSNAGGGTYVATGTDGSTGMTVTGAKGFGIDVSSWQGTIDWAMVKASGIVDYAIIRCGWGDNFRSQDDREFLNNVRGCLNNGIPFGIYIYSYAYNTSMAQSEASHVMRLLSEAGLSPSKVAYPIYLDLEQQDSSGRPSGMDDGVFHTVSNQMLEQIAITFCSSIENAGYNAGVYANKNWWTNYLTESSFGEWSKWVAQYNTSCTYSGSYDMWQCMSNGRIPGIDGNVDINFDFVDLENLAPEDPSNGGTAAMYRLYNPNTGEHLYTSDRNERNTLVRIGWIYEQIGWHAPSSSSTPVYRLYNPNNGDHHYTTDSHERDVLRSIGWNYENICWYSDDSKEVVLYRLFNPNQLGPGAHHYTRDANERDTLVRLGWRSEGIAWYGLK